MNGLKHNEHKTQHQVIPFLVTSFDFYSHQIGGASFSILVTNFFGASSESPNRINDRAGHCASQARTPTSSRGVCDNA